MQANNNEIDFNCFPVQIPTHLPSTSYFSVLSNFSKLYYRPLIYLYIYLFIHTNNKQYLCIYIYINISFYDMIGSILSPAPIWLAPIHSIKSKPFDWLFPGTTDFPFTSPFTNKRWSFSFFVVDKVEKHFSYHLRPQTPLFLI